MTNSTILIDNQPGDELDIKYVINILWESRRFILACLLVGVIITGIYAYKRKVYFESDSLLWAQDATNSVNDKKFDMLSSLTGINLNGQNSDNSEIAQHLIYTRKFTNDFVQKHNLLPELFAAIKWNKQDEALVYNTKLYDKDNQKWNIGPDGKLPTSDDVQSVFTKTVILEKLENNFYRLITKHASPVLAKQINDWLVEDINDWMRTNEIDSAENHIAVLNKKLDITNVAEHQQLIYNMLDAQQQKKLLAYGNNEFVFKLVDPATIPQHPVNKKKLILALGLAFSFMLSVILVLFHKLAFSDTKKVPV